jgi:hypothetical protein
MKTRNFFRVLFLLVGLAWISSPVVGQRAVFSEAKFEHLERPTVPQELVRDVQFSVHCRPEFFTQEDMRRWGGNISVLKSDAERLERMAYWTLEREMVWVDGNADLRVEVALGEGRAGTPVIKSGPVRSGSEQLTYWAEIPYNMPVRVQIVRADGTLLDGFEVKGEVKVQYGNEPYSTLDKTATGISYSTTKLDYRSEAELRKGLATEEGERFVRRKAILMQMSAMIDLLEPRLFFSRDKVEVSIATAKGKNFDYMALDGAQEAALAAFKAMRWADLEGPMGVWTAWLQKSDLLNPKAEVNTDVTRGLHLNLAVAHIYRESFAEAAQHLSQARGMTRATDPEWAQLEGLTDLLMRRRKAQLYNAAVASVDAATPTFKAPDMKELLGRRSENRDLQLFDGRDRYAEVGEALSAWQASLSGSAPEAQAGTAAERTTSQAIGSRLEPTMGGYMLRFNPLFDAARVGQPMAPEIFAVDRLVYLDYSRMGLTEVPDAIASMTALKTLLLDGNALTAFPVAVCQVPTLQKLHLKGNGIADIPPGLADCKMLEMIDLRGNPLTPEARAALPTLLPPDCKVKLE